MASRPMMADNMGSMSPATTGEGDAETLTGPVPVGVIGCGRMGRLHARVFSQMPQVRLVGVVDANFEAARQTAEQYGGKAFGSPGELVGQVRAVTIATPTVTHLEVCLPLLKAGIACLIEKPLATNVLEARRIVEAGREHGGLVQV